MEIPFAAVEEDLILLIIRLRLWISDVFEDFSLLFGREEVGNLSVIEDITDIFQERFREDLRV